VSRVRPAVASAVGARMAEVPMSITALSMRPGASPTNIRAVWYAVPR
jgi:hypothetical protein